MTALGDGDDRVGASAAGNMPVRLALVRLARHLKINLGDNEPYHADPQHAVVARAAPKPANSMLAELPALARVVLIVPPRPMITPYYVKEALHTYRGIDGLSKGHG